MSISNNSKTFFEACLVSAVLRSPPPSYISNNIAAIVVNIVLAIAGTILNSFVLFMFWKSAKLRSKLSYFSIMLLSSIDLGVVTVVHPLFVLKSSTTILGSAKCLYIITYTIAISFFLGISTLTLIIINIERYFSIIHPVLHRNHFTRRRLVLTWVFLWFFVIVNVVSRIYFNFLAKVIPITLSIAVFTSLYTYVAIFVVARKKMLKTIHNQESSRNRMAFLRELKMAKTYVFVVSLCLVCYLPAPVVFGIQNPLLVGEKISDSVVNASIWATTLMTMNSTLNCLVFFWGNRDMRQEGSKILKRCFHGQGDQ